MDICGQKRTDKAHVKVNYERREHGKKYVNLLLSIIDFTSLI